MRSVLYCYLLFMALRVFLREPIDLVDSIKKLIDSKKVSTWSYDSEGDFTHNVDQWRYKAWIRPRLSEDSNQVLFNILGRNDKTMTKSEYAVFHGRFAEMLLIHFDMQISRIELTALPTSTDRIGEDKSE